MSSRQGIAPPPSLPPGQDELPYDDGAEMESKRHRVQLDLLVRTLDDAWADRDDFYVNGNTFVYFFELQLRGQDFRGPDVFVVLGTTRKERKSWVVWEEGGLLPNVVIELLSESTEAIDRGDKMRVYARIWRTPEYFLYDPFTGALEGYALDVAKLAYTKMEPNERGELASRQLGLSLGVRAGTQAEMDAPWLRWIDADGSVLTTGEERAVIERQRAEAERRRAEELAAQLEAYERRFGPLGG